MLLVAAWSYGTGKRHRRSLTSSQLSLRIEIQNHHDPYHTPIPDTEADVMLYFLVNPNVDIG